MPRRRRETPWLERRADGVFYVFWYEPGRVGPDGKRSRGRSRRFSLHTTEASQAQARYAAFLAERGQEKYAREDVSNGLTVADALDDYRREHVAEKVVDKDRIDDAIDNLKAFFGTRTLKEVDIPMSRQYADARRTGRVGKNRLRGKKARILASDGTIRRELGVLVAAGNHALRWKRIKADDLPAVDLPAAPPPRERWLTHDELARLRKVSRGKVADFIEIAYYTAARKRSIETLTWFQVDLERGRINLAKPGERKTVKRRPVVPIDPELMPTLRRLWEEKRSEFVLGSPGTVRTNFLRAVKRAGLADVTQHTLRHTRATHLLQSGAPPWAVANLLGDTLQTVLRVYGHHCPEFLAEVMSKKESESGR